MPSDTFFRLPEAKRRRLLDAAWDEFTNVRFSDASINKIIRAARIPRGSFYQYFDGKDDLFAYLVRPLQQHFIGLACQEVKQSRGDISQAPLAIYDRFFQSGEQFSLDLKRCIQVVQRNPESEFHTMLCGPDAPIHSVLALVDTTRLRCKDPTYIQEVFRLLIFTIVSSIIDTLNCPDQRQTNREQLALRVEILMSGCIAPTIPATQGGTL